MTRWSRELAEDGSPTGAGRLVAWLALHWSGDIDAGSSCACAADDPRFSQDTRDLFVGIATTDRFSLDRPRMQSPWRRRGGTTNR
jgi:hypothetical protein